MKCNVGGMDRNGRGALGVALPLVWALFSGLGMSLHIVVLVIAAVALVTAVMSGFARPMPWPESCLRA